MPKKHAPETSTLEVVFSGVRFSKDGGAWCVSEAGSAEGAVSIVGPMLDPRPGWSLRLLDTSRSTHPRFGSQVKYRSYEWIGLSDRNGLVRYLAALCDGIGHVTAERIVDAFPTDTLETLRAEPDRVAAKVKGLHIDVAVLASDILRQNEAQEKVQVLLRAAGCGDGRVAALLSALDGPESLLTQIQENPWAIAEMVDGVGFKIADALAIQAGHPHSSPLRAAAALAHLVKEACDQEGNTWASPDDLGKGAAALKIPPTAFDQAVAECLDVKDVIDGDRNAQPIIVRAPVPGGLALTPFGLWRAETRIREKIHALIAGGNTEHAWDERILGDFQLDEFQGPAIELLRSSPVAVVTGGPGTGKSHMIEAVYRALSKEHAVEIMAPTGKAAARIREMGIPASTIHKALRIGFKEPSEKKEEGDRIPLDGPVGPGEFEADIVICDESSMIDSSLMAALLRALRPGTHLYLFGDADQLPPVGPGMPFRDVISSGAVPVARLLKIHRQTEGSWLTRNCHTVNTGTSPYFADEVDDCFLEEVQTPQEAEETVVNLVARRMPGYFKLNPNDIQVLSPKNMGPASVDALNEALRAALNPTGRPGLRGFREGDKVIHTRNNYQIGVMNGEVGIVQTAMKNALWIDFDGSVVQYDAQAASQLRLAYAISIHRSQGSQFPVVVVVVLKTHAFMLSRQLLYTGMSRAKTACVIVGTKAAISMAVRKPGAKNRSTFLAHWLREDAGKRAGIRALVDSKQRPIEITATPF